MPGFWLYSQARAKAQRTEATLERFASFMLEKFPLQTADTAKLSLQLSSNRPRILLLHLTNCKLMPAIGPGLVSGPRRTLHFLNAGRFYHFYPVKRAFPLARKLLLSVTRDFEKNVMTPKSLLIGSITSTCLALATQTTALAGTDILHFLDHAPFTNNGVATNASGTVNARENKQGNADNESVTLSFKGLNTNAPYTLQISTVHDTNLTSVSDFTTDSLGRANLNFGNLGNGQGIGHGKLPLPTAMDPLSALRSFAVVDTNTLAVILSADLTVSNHLQYLIKRDLSTNGITATLRIQANNQNAHVRVSARGLAATNDYYLVLNGGIVQTNSTDAHGHLELGSTLLNPLDVLDLRSVAVWDTGNNVVVSTTLP
jgi:hypothetical protein